MDPLAKKILTEFESKSGKSIQHLAEQLRTIRTGRASPALVETIRVDYYGAMTPVSQLAHISVPEPRQLMVKPFDPSVLKEVERAILKSDLGLTPQSDGKVLRLTLPPLSEEQRKKLVHKIRELAETARVALRNERRDANKHADQAKKDGKLTEDANKLLHDQVQEALKNAAKQVDEILEKKSAEILED
jgi:ribosome recycling factor